ncbi:hypothetical protein KCU72_g87, partial [Aureobasidium melanogenum]
LSEEAQEVFWTTTTFSCKLWDNHWATLMHVCTAMQKFPPRRRPKTVPRMFPASGNSRKSPIPNFKSTFSTTTSRERRKRPTHITPPNRSSPIGTSLKTWSAIPAGSPSICRPFPTRMSRRRMEASLSNLLLNDCESEDMPRPNHFD